MNEAFPVQEHHRHLVSDLRRKSARLSALNDLALRLMSIPTGDELLWYVARGVVGRLGFDDCVVYLVDPERQMLRQTAAIGNKNPRDDEIANALEIPVGDGITGAVAESMQAIVVDDLREDSRYISDVGVARSEICVPLVIDKPFRRRDLACVLREMLDRGAAPAVRPSSRP